MDARPRQAAEARRPLRRLGRPRARARSYLQTNCAHCHQFNAGGTANIALGYDLPLEQTETVGERPIQGTFNIAGARIIAPGDPASSVLYYRMSKLGGGRMPRVGSDMVDERATRMIHDWIARMPAAKTGRPTEAAAKRATEDRDAIDGLQQADRLAPAARTAAIGRLASSTRGALLLLGMIDRGRASEHSAERRGRRSRGRVRSSKCATCSSGSFPRKNASSGWVTWSTGRRSWLFVGIANEGD